MWAQSSSGQTVGLCGLCICTVSLQMRPLAMDDVVFLMNALLRLEFKMILVLMKHNLVLHVLQNIVTILALSKVSTIIFVIF
jgi:hypothetical protein